MRFQVDMNLENTIELSFPGGVSGKELAYKRRRLKRCGFNPCVGKIPRRRAWQPTPVFLLEESYGLRSLEDSSHMVAKSWRWLKRLSTYAFTLLCPPSDMILLTYLIQPNIPLFLMYFM